MSNRLTDFVIRIERQTADKAAVAEKIKAIYVEAKAAGYNTKAIREIVRLRQTEPAKRVEYEQVRARYLSDLGMLAGTPLGDAATRRETVKAELTDESGEVVWDDEVPA